MPQIGKRLNNLLKLLLILVPVINILWLAVSVALAWPEWWLYINYEKSPLTWFSSVQLFSIGLSLVFLFVLEFDSILRLFWLALSGAFFVFSLDERFQFHERLREKIFKPHEIGTHIPGVGAGDFLFPLIAILGIIFSYFLLVRIKTDRKFYILFFLALLFSAVATAFDAQPISVTDIPMARLHQFYEEILETLGQMCFLLSFLVVIQEKIRTLNEKK